jgi:hypothetical protein
MTEEWNSAPHKVTHDEARLEQLRYWAGKTVQERLEAADALTLRMLRLRGIDRDELKADWTVRRVSRQGR